jgi:hypothetical protein
MNIEVTAVVVFSLITISAGIFVSNFFDSYERKIVKIKTAILGLLVNAKNDLVKLELNKGLSHPAKIGQGKKTIKKGQEKEYEDFITYMQESSFLKYANEHEELLYFEGCGQKKVHKLALTVGSFFVPTILLQQDGNLLFIGGLWLSLNFSFFMIFIVDIHNMIKRIDKLYKEYIIGKESFGGYDS